MDNKLSELSKPVAWTDERGNLCTNRNKERGLESRYHQDYEKYTTPFYSQEYVSALLARIAELERANTSQDDHINQQQDRIEFLEKTNAGLGRRLGDAEKRLATPVRLQSPWVDKVGNRWLLEGTTADVIRVAGFAVTIEGDE
ncbi:hypothetical protein [Serratia sp. TMDUHS_CL]|uniref:hypothetical protein n=1 Tax=Serratia sp. TMDUHS_CL TaxID=3128862 RepID=UPI0030189483